MRQRLEKEDGGVHKHQTRCRDAHVARQFVRGPAKARQSRSVLHQTLPEAAQSPVVRLHMARGVCKKKKEPYEKNAIQKVPQTFESYVISFGFHHLVFSDMRSWLSNTLHQVCGEGMFVITWIVFTHKRICVGQGSCLPLHTQIGHSQHTAWSVYQLSVYMPLSFQKPFCADASEGTFATRSRC